MEVIQARDTSRPFVMSSPSNGQESVEEGYVASNPYDARYGDGKVQNKLQCKNR